MRLRPYIIGALLKKDIARLLRNGPALMLIGLVVIVSLLAGSSGIAEPANPQQASRVAAGDALSWIVYWEDSPWVEQLKLRAPDELRIKFVEGEPNKVPDYPPNVCVVELRPEMIDRGRGQIRRQVRYRYPGSDPAVLWPVTRWFLSVSLEHFADMPQLFETIQPLAPPAGGQRSGTGQSALERLSVADVLSLPLIGTALLTTILFFSACGLLVTMTAQERERGALRALLLTPATYFEFVVSKGILHGALALGGSAVVVAALLPSALTSLLFWGTIVTLTCGYFSVGLLLAAFARSQAAPNLLSFAYMLFVGALNLLGARLESFQHLSSLTFERYGLMFTITSLTHRDLGAADSLGLMRSTPFQAMVLLVCGLLAIATFVGSKRLVRG
ncbi:MAG: ABC transporter permease subunit [Planctomycetota bacterium]